MTRSAEVSYFMMRPLAVNVALALMDNEKGMTATDLAEEFGVSVPTMYRLTSEMEELGLLTSKRVGRKKIFTLTNDMVQSIERIAQSLQKTLQRNPIEQRLVVTKMLREDFIVPLSPRYRDRLIRTALKRKVKELLPRGFRERRPRFTEILGDKPSFDLTVGTNNKIIGIEIKSLETSRNVRERLGILASYALIERTKLHALILVYLIYPIGGTKSWLINKEEVEKMIEALNLGDLPLVPIVIETTEPQVLDPSFLESIAQTVVKKVLEVTRE
ncbi:MAG: helix-turn-helix domain-containing protein [Candidatus Baldrarchaeia archaeon]